jgi:hypothetical protein
VKTSLVDGLARKPDDFARAYAESDGPAAVAGYVRDVARPDPALLLAEARQRGEDLDGSPRRETREAVEPGLRDALEFIETYKAPWGAAKSDFWEEHGFSRGGSPNLRALGIIEDKLRALLTDAPARQRDGSPRRAMREDR